MAEPEPDLSPVAAPKNTVAVGRWLNVDASLKTLEKLGKLPFPLRGILEKELEDKEMIALLKLDAPVDAVAMIDPSSSVDNPKPLGVVSLPIRDLKEALALASRAGKPLSLRPGVHRLGRNRDFICDLSVAVGAAPARLLCSEHERDLDLLVPWMTRGLPNEKLGGSDLHLELRAEGLRERYKAELEQFGPLLPNMVNEQLVGVGIKHQGLIDLLSGAAADAPKFAADLDALAIDVRLDGEKSEISSSGTIRFKGTSSWVARLMTHRNDKAGPPPAMFWQAPKTSDSVSFNRGSDPKFFDGLREVLASGSRELLTGKIDGADVQAVSDLLAKIPLVDPQAVVVARGHQDSTEKPKTIKRENFKPADAIRETQTQVRGALGWSLVGVEAKSDVYAEWLKSLVKTYSSRTLQGTFKKVLGNKSSNLPTMKTVGAPRGAPKGTLAVEISVPISSRDVWYSHGRIHDYSQHPKGDAKGTLTFLLTVTPDGNRTWIGLSADPKLLGDQLAIVKDGASKDATLAARPGLDALKSGSFTGGGFLSMGGLLKTATNTLRSSLSDRDREKMEKVFSAMPNKGETPILLFTNGTTGATPSNSIEVRLQKGTIDDLATLGLLMFSARDRSAPAAVEAPAAPASP